MIFRLCCSVSCCSSIVLCVFLFEPGPQQVTGYYPCDDNACGDKQELVLIWGKSGGNGKYPAADAADNKPFKPQDDTREKSRHAVYCQQGGAINDTVRVVLFAA